MVAGFGGGQHLRYYSSIPERIRKRFLEVTKEPRDPGASQLGPAQTDSRLAQVHSALGPPTATTGPVESAETMQSEAARILVLPGEPPVRRGPYRVLRHPNYIAVVVELAAVPLIFDAWITALVAGG
jgi:hypothetical protein